MVHAKAIYAPTFSSIEKGREERREFLAQSSKESSEGVKILTKRFSDSLSWDQRIILFYLYLISAITSRQLSCNSVFSCIGASNNKKKRKKRKQGEFLRWVFHKTLGEWRVGCMSLDPIASDCNTRASGISFSKTTFSIALNPCLHQRKRYMGFLFNDHLHAKTMKKMVDFGSISTGFLSMLVTHVGECGLCGCIVLNS